MREYRVMSSEILRGIHGGYEIEGDTNQGFKFYIYLKMCKITGAIN